MKRVIAFSLFMAFILPINSQDVDKLQKSLDSLKALKVSYQNKISDIDNEYNRIRELITDLRFEQSQGETYYCKTRTNITQLPTSVKPIGFISSGDPVKVIDRTDSHFKILSNNVTGWVLKAALYSEAEYQQVIDTKKAEALAKEEAAQAEREKRRADLTKEYGSVTAQKILDGMIWLGMTNEMTLESIGKPISINRTVGTWGVHEQWIYDNQRYLYFENGKLTSWQD